jgi:hypothetical protein
MEQKRDSIMFCCDINDIGCANKLLGLYDKRQNNIFIFDNVTFDNYLLYNDVTRFYENFILKSLINNISYVSMPNPNIIPFIKIIINSIILDINYKYSNSKYGDDIKNLFSITEKEQNFLKINQEEFDRFNVSFNNIYHNFVYT